MDLNAAIIAVRAIHFGACMLTTGAVFFAVFIAADARTALRPRLVAIAWISLGVTVISGAAWLLLTAQSMSGQPLAAVVSRNVLWTVLSRTDFGNDWLLRLVLAVLLAGTFASVFSVKGSAEWMDAVAVAAAAALVGSLAWAGHAIGASGIEGIVHPGADVLHLIAAAAWLGTLPLLALLLAMAQRGGVPLAAAQSATLRFSTLGILSVGTIAATGIINTWYLVGNPAALVGTTYGRLLLAKGVLFFAMLAAAAVNRLRLTPRLVHGASPATGSDALRQLRRNAVGETLFGVLIVVIVGVLGTQPPASHANHHPVYGAVPADAAFIHIHTEQAMADVTITPGRTGPARATIRLWDEDSEQIDARELTLTLVPPSTASKPVTRVAVQDADGAWQVDRIALSQSGNWMVTVDATIGSTGHVVLAAPIVIEPEP